MQTALQFLLSHFFWGVVFLWPLTSQLLLQTGWVSSVQTAYLIGAMVAIPWGVMAQLRGSWIWLK